MRDTADVPPENAALGDHVHTTSGWDVVDTAPTIDRGVGVGSCFLAGNGYLGYRGTCPEQLAVDFVGCVVSDTYDMADGVWRELCTVPNGLYVELAFDGEAVRFDDERPSSVQLSLDRGEVTHRWFARTDRGATVELTMRRFASLDDHHVVAQQVTARAERSGELTVAAGIDDDVWSLNGEHFRSVDTAHEAGTVLSRCTTVERGTDIAVAASVSVDGLVGAHPPTPRSPAARGRTTTAFTGRVTAGSEVTVESVMAIASSNDDDVEGDPADLASRSAGRCAAAGYWQALAASAARWAHIWDAADVRIGGDLAAQAALRFSIYHHRIAVPAHSDRLPVGARGLSCQAYQGAAFWDQEMFNLPALLHTEPDVARRLLVYRWRTLDGARRKAQRLGYEGAFYAWVSGDTGDELCPDFFFVDVLTGRPIRNHFNVWQIHISPDIAHAVWSYWEATGDVDFLAEHGAEIVFEVARFLHSRVLWSEVRNRFELIRLLGPDEWHENVDHNAYTAHLTRLTMQHALAIHRLLADRRPAALAELCESIDVDADDVDAWARVEATLFEPGPDPDTSLIEPFDGFFDLADCRPDDLRKRLIDPGEYWGWPNGVAVHTQVSKQPDVVQMFAIDPAFPLEVQRANYDYFEPRCSHGSSLSHSVHATVAARLASFDRSYVEQAYDYFMQTAALDLRSTAHSVVGGTFIGGMHTAANAGAYQTAVFGFGGFSMTEGTVRIVPALPPAWTSLDYHVIVHGQRLAIAVTPADVTVTASSDNTSAVPVCIGVDASPTLVEPGAHVTG